METLKFCRPLEKIFEDRFFWRSPKNVVEDLFLVFGEHLPPVSLVLGLKHFCPLPRESLFSKGLSLALTSNIPVLCLERVLFSEGLFLALESDFFVSLALASSLVSSTPPLVTNYVTKLHSRRHLICCSVKPTHFLCKTALVYCVMFERKRAIVELPSCSYALIA